MYKFNYWSIPISQEALDIRYFLFDCVQTNYKPHNPLFLGPSYKQAFLTDDVYSKEDKSVRSLSPHNARIVRNNDKKVQEQSKHKRDEEKKGHEPAELNGENKSVFIKNLNTNKASSVTFSSGIFFLISSAIFTVMLVVY